MKENKLITICSILKLALLIGLLNTFLACENHLEDCTLHTKDGNTIYLRIEIARSAEERARGFMHRKNIPEGTGMLFVFDSEQVLHFWMKDTPVPLSIAFIDKSGTIKEIKHMQAFSLETVSSTFSCLYALEVPSGWFDKVGIFPGDTISLSQLPVN